MSSQLEPSGRAFWDRTADRYERSMWFFGGPMPRMLELVGSETSGLGRVLELGAGPGLVTRVLARSAGEVVSTDYSESMVSRLEARRLAEGWDNVTCRQLDVYALEPGETPFDAVVMANLLHLLPRPRLAIERAQEVLTPGGRLIVPTFCHDQTFVSKLTSRLLDLFGFPGERRFTTESLRRTVLRPSHWVRHQELIPGLLPIGFLSLQLVEHTHAGQR